jgi:predicted alpha/beta superfamily hydrolase
MDSLRNRDYTYTEAHPNDGFRTSGGGEKFYGFIRSELVPYVERTYRTDATSRTIMGHSLGGYFVLYALLRDKGGGRLFNHYIAASSSISYDDEHIIKQFEKLSHQNEYHGKSTLYLTTGGLENVEDHGKRFKHFARLFAGLDCIQLKVTTYEGMEHMGTAVPSFEDGLESIFLD